MKTDRLIAITMYLLNRDVVSASALAERFEVSKRTIQRDIEALCQAGIPIVSTYGASGGYAVMDGFGLAKQAAGADDQWNIIMALKALSTAYADKSIEATLEKALYSMQAGEPHIFVDFSAAREGLDIDARLSVLEKAVRSKTLLRIEYTNADGRDSERIIEPLALSFQWHGWYLFAYCTSREDYRLFKLARISGCEIAQGSFSREHGNIERLMKGDSAPDNRKWYSFRLLCKGEIRRQALEYLGGNIVEEHKNGDFILSINLPFERMWFSLIMSFGDKVKVLDSDELSDMLQQKAKEILSVYTVPKSK